MDLALNTVNIDKSALKSMSSEKMKESTSAEASSTKKYEIDVPRVPDEFPDMGNKAADIYPLPLSHENQCTTIGVANNLEMFQEEFDFKSNKNVKYLPLKSSGKSLIWNRAYKRFAFLRKLDRHKEQQEKYANTLRGCTPSEHSDHVEAAVVFVVSENEEDSDDE